MERSRMSQSSRNDALYKRRQVARRLKRSFGRYKRQRGTPRPVRNSMLDDLLHYVDPEDYQELMDMAYDQGLTEGGPSQEEVQKTEGSWVDIDLISTVAGN